MKGLKIESWNHLLENVNKNIDYWAYYISSRTKFRIEKEDAKQTLLIKTWDYYNKKNINGNKITAYFIQQWLGWISKRIVILDVKREETRRKRGNWNEIDLESTDSLETIASSETTIEEKMLSECERELVSRTLKRFFSEIEFEAKAKNKFNELKVIECFKNGMRNKDISQEVGINEGKVSNIITRYIKRPIKSIYHTKLSEGIENEKISI